MSLDAPATAGSPHDPSDAGKKNCTRALLLLGGAVSLYGVLYGVATTRVAVSTPALGLGVAVGTMAAAAGFFFGIGSLVQAARRPDRATPGFAAAAVLAVIGNAYMSVLGGKLALLFAVASGG